ncbi:MAG: hypothetical protein RMM53_01045 [Bacteroidia bacterium]|nr:hypothetical protein [Bacteroidia bacterium]MDW8332779.1 hypothetical protein [Bacteroidia bacterium]
MVAEVVMPDVSAVSIAIYWKNNAELDVYLVSGAIRTYRGAEAEAVFAKLTSANFPVEVIE